MRRGPDYAAWCPGLAMSLNLAKWPADCACQEDLPVAAAPAGEAGPGRRHDARCRQWRLELGAGVRGWSRPGPPQDASLSAPRHGTASPGHFALVWGHLGLRCMLA